MFFNIEDDPPMSENLKGSHQAVIISVDDPESRGRIKTIIPDIFEANDPNYLPWVYPDVNSGLERSDLGSFKSPEINSQVSVRFLNGDIYSPVYSNLPINKQSNSPLITSPDDVILQAWPNKSDNKPNWFKINKSDSSFQAYFGHSNTTLNIDGEGNVTIKSPKSLIGDFGEYINLKGKKGIVLESDGDCIIKANNVSIDSKANIGMIAGGFISRDAKVVFDQSGRWVSPNLPSLVDVKEGISSLSERLSGYSLGDFNLDLDEKLKDLVGEFGGELNSTLMVSLGDRLGALGSQILGVADIIPDIVDLSSLSRRSYDLFCFDTNGFNSIRRDLNSGLLGGLESSFNSNLSVLFNGLNILVPGLSDLISFSDKFVSGDIVPEDLFNIALVISSDGFRGLDFLDPDEVRKIKDLASIVSLGFDGEDILNELCLRLLCSLDEYDGLIPGLSDLFRLSNPLDNVNINDVLESLVSFIGGRLDGIVGRLSSLSVTDILCNSKRFGVSNVITNNYEVNELIRLSNSLKNVAVSGVKGVIGSILDIANFTVPNQSDLLNAANDIFNTGLLVSGLSSGISSEFAGLSASSRIQRLRNPSLVASLVKSKADREREFWKSYSRRFKGTII